MSARLAPAAALLLAAAWAPAARAQVEQLTWEDPTLAAAVREADLVVVGRVTDVSPRGAVYEVERSVLGPDRVGARLAVAGLHHPQRAEGPPVRAGDRAYLLLNGDPAGEGFVVPTPTFGRFALREADGRPEVIASVGGADTFARLAIAPGRFEALLRAARTGREPRLLASIRRTLAESAPSPEALYWALQGLTYLLPSAPDEARLTLIPTLRAVLADPRHADPTQIRVRLAAAQALACAGGRPAVGVLLDLAANADLPALRSVAAGGVPRALGRANSPRLTQAATQRLAAIARRADAQPVLFAGARDPRTNRIESPLAACLFALADLGGGAGVAPALEALERDDLDAIQAGLAFFVRLGEVAHAAEVAARMRPPGDDAFVNPLFVRCLEDLTGERLGPEPAAWRQWAARRRAGPPTPEGPR